MTQPQNSPAADPAQPGFWVRTWNLICAYEEAMNRDPAHELRRRIRDIEAKVKSLEAKGRKDDHAQI